MTDMEQKKIFAANLLRYLDINNKSQIEVAKAIDVSPQTFNTWCQGKALPRMGKVQKLADYFKINKSNLIDPPFKSSDDFEPPVPGTYKTVMIPVFYGVSAGENGTIMDPGDIAEWIDIPEQLAKRGEFFGFKIRGDSMAPDIKDGDIVIVRRQDVAEHGNTVVAVVNGDEGFCKRLAKYADGLGLLSNNPVYKPMYFSAEEVINLPVRIVGKVERLVRRF